MVDIRPLEKKKNNLSMGLKISFLLMLVATGVILDRFFLKNLTKQTTPSVLGKSQTIDTQAGADLLSESITKTKELSGEVLGQSISFVTDLTTQAASTAADLVYQNTLGKLVEQISKLPEDQQERVREQICK